MSARHRVARLKPWVIALVIAGVLVYLSSLLFIREDGSINVTGADLRSARTRWQSQNIAAYEIVVSYVTKSCLGEPQRCGTWTLRVDDSRIDIVGYEAPWDIPPEVISQTHGSDLEFLTVDALFAEIEKTLNKGEFKENGYLLDYKVAFNEQLGYPTEFRYDGKPSRNGDGGQSALAYHTGSRIEVNSLTVIRQR
jgi:hypothetical protein